MPVKMTGAQYKKFMTSDWGPDACWEDYVLTINGQEADPNADETEGMADSDIIIITGGMIIPDQANPDMKSFEAEPFARTWLKQQTHTCIIVEVSKADKGKLSELLGKSGLDIKIVT